LAQWPTVPSVASCCTRAVRKYTAFRRPCHGFQQINKGEILLPGFSPAPGRKDLGHSTHPPLFPAANRLPRGDQAQSPCSLKGTRQPPIKIRKAVFPVAGLGTRVLPATKAMPKEMLTIVDKPLIQYVVDEAREAGIEHFIFVTGRNKGVIEDHFDRVF